jgi:acetyltransferase-like isoleucine patch superfamily enzyme
VSIGERAYISTLAVVGDGTIIGERAFIGARLTLQGVVELAPEAIVGIIGE